jgi:glycosyltransferase involved in cell wall biosynthesis
MPDSRIGQQLRSAGLVTVIESNLHRWPTYELRRVADIFRDGCFDILHTHNSRAHFFGVMLRYLYGIPCVATAHQNHFQLHWALNDFVIANSAATLRYQRRYNFVLRSRSAIIHYPIDTARFEQVTATQRIDVRMQFGLADDDLAIGIVGNIESRKGHHYMVRALPKILTAVPKAKLVVVGRASATYMRQLHGEIAALGVDRAIIWAGFRVDIPMVMHALDVCVCAAIEEAFGLTAAEALAAGTPVVATNVGGLPESVIPGKTGILVPPRNPEALAQALIAMLNDPVSRSRFGQAGQNRVRALFSNEAHFSALEQRYAELHTARRPKLLTSEDASRRKAA